MCAITVPHAYTRRPYSPGKALCGPRLIKYLLTVLASEWNYNIKSLKYMPKRLTSPPRTCSIFAHVGSAINGQGANGRWFTLIAFKMYFINKIYICPALGGGGRRCSLEMEDRPKYLLNSSWCKWGRIIGRISASEGQMTSLPVTIPPSSRRSCNYPRG